MNSLRYKQTTFLKGQKRAVLEISLFEKPDTIMIVFSQLNFGGEIKRDVSNCRKWWFQDGQVCHVLSISDTFACCLKCRVSVSNKVTFLFNRQLMKTEPIASFTHLICSTNYCTTGSREQHIIIKTRQKESERQGNILLCSSLIA